MSRHNAPAQCRMRESTCPPTITIHSLDRRHGHWSLNAASYPEFVATSSMTCSPPSRTFSPTDLTLPRTSGHPDLSLPRTSGHPDLSLPRTSGHPDLSLPRTLGHPDLSLPRTSGHPDLPLPRTLGHPDLSLPRTSSLPARTYLSRNMKPGPAIHPVPDLQSRTSSPDLQSRGPGATPDPEPQPPSPVSVPAQFSGSAGRTGC